MNIFANLGNIVNQSQSQNQKPVVCSCLQHFFLILILTLAFDFWFWSWRHNFTLLRQNWVSPVQSQKNKVKKDFSQAKNQICKVKPKFGRQIFLSNEAPHTYILLSNKAHNKSPQYSIERFCFSFVSYTRGLVSLVRLLPICYREMENTMWYTRTSFMLNPILNFNILYLVAVLDLNSNFPISL